MITWDYKCDNNRDIIVHVLDDLEGNVDVGGFVGYEEGQQTIRVLTFKNKALRTFTYPQGLMAEIWLYLSLISPLPPNRLSNDNQPHEHQTT